MYQDTNHYLDYPSMILRKEESLGEFNNFATWMLVTDFFITNHIVENLNDSSCIFLERTSFPRLYLCSNSLHSRMKIRQKYPQITGKLCQNFQFMIRSHIIWNIWYFVIPLKDTLLEAFYGNFLTVNNMTTKQWKEAIRQNVRFKCWDGHSQSFVPQLSAGKLLKPKIHFRDTKTWILQTGTN